MAFDERSRNDDNDAPAHALWMLLKSVLLAYSPRTMLRMLSRACAGGCDQQFRQSLIGVLLTIIAVRASLASGIFVPVSDIPDPRIVAGGLIKV